MPDEQGGQATCTSVGRNRALWKSAHSARFPASHMARLPALPRLIGAAIPIQAAPMSE